MKAIIVIDMPKVCGECRASFCGDVWYCYAGEYRRPLFTENIQEKPSWCPLKPLPCKKYMRQMPSDVLEKSQRKRDFIIHKVDVDNSYVEGWNACLDEILGETEGWNACLDEITGETE